MLTRPKSNALRRPKPKRNPLLTARGEALLSFLEDRSAETKKIYNKASAPEIIKTARPEIIENALAAAYLIEVGAMTVQIDPKQRELAELNIGCRLTG